MKRRLLLVTVSFVVVILSGCWDERLLKDHSLVLSLGHDIGNDETLINTVTFAKDSSGGEQQNSSSKQSKVIMTTGDTVKDAENKMDQIIPQKFDKSKAKIILLGEDFAARGIFSTMDSIYRDLRGPLYASVAIVKGTAKDALYISEDYNQLVSDLYTDLLNSSEEGGLTKQQNVQEICPVILSEGRDIVLPHIRIEQENTAIIDGLALFSGDKMTGTLDETETTMYLILSDQISQGTKLNFKITNDKKVHDKNFVDFVIRKNKRKLKVLVDKGTVKAEVNGKLRIEIDEYPADHLHDEKKVKELTGKIEKKVNELAKQTITKMQKANNDSLGIGDEVRAHHSSTWEEIKWSEVYPDIPIEAKFKVKIVRHGIIN